MGAPSIVVHKDSYHDSVLLMRVSQGLEQHDGVEDAVVAMGTPLNKELLDKGGYDSPELTASGPNDLIIAVRGSLSAEEVEAAVAELLKADEPTATEALRPMTLAAAVKAQPDANLVLISLPGEHAAREAKRALALGRHVMVFSDNVTVEDEVALKKEAADKGLLMMGPDCGTAIVNGKPLAFANVVRQGSIGVVGASGTGIQEVTSCIHRLGGGVSQAIGTGGRDLSDAVGGLTTLLGIEALSQDPSTAVIVVISKPPSPNVAEKVVASLGITDKPCVVHFVGAESRPPDDKLGITFADTLAGTAEDACRLAGVELGEIGAGPDPKLVDKLAKQLKPGAALRGLFCGGTTGYEALVMLKRAGLKIRSNLHKKGPLKVAGLDPVSGHVVLDLGEDLFTRGRPHPMIEPMLRNERLELEMEDPDVGLLLFDVVLGYGSHDDPAGLTAQSVAAARETGRPIVAIGSVTGTPDDPQDFETSKKKLESAGVVVMPDNRRAVELATAVLGRIGGRIG